MKNYLELILKKSNKLALPLCSSLITALYFMKMDTKQIENEKVEISRAKSEVWVERKALMNEKLALLNERNEVTLKEQVLQRKEEDLISRAKTLDYKESIINEKLTIANTHKKIQSLINNIKKYDPVKEKDARAIEITVGQIEDLVKTNNLNEVYSESLISLSSYVHYIDIARLHRRWDKEELEFFQTKISNKQ